MGLRVRRADTAPGAGAAEYFGRGPASLVNDLDCSLQAKGAYLAITLAIAEDRTSSVCPDRFMRTMADLAFTLGITERHARRLVGELEARGHVAREKVRTISGSPQAIRVTATLKGRSTRTNPSGCTRADPSGQPDAVDRAPGRICPPDRTTLPGPYRRESQTEEESKQTTAQGPDVVAPLSRPGEGEPGRPGLSDFLGRLSLDLATALSEPGRKKSPASRTAKSGHGAKSRDGAVPDANNSTGEPGQLSRDEPTKLT